MECPFCKSDSLKVLESRSADDGRSIRRRRECISCEQRFTTYERVEFSPMVVIKRSGSKQVFSRDKLVSSIIRSCSKAQISALTIDAIVDRVEARMFQEYSREIPSAELGEMVMSELRQTDPVAYLRYASIFKKINSLDEFVEELKNFNDQKLEDSMLGIDFQSPVLIK